MENLNKFISNNKTFVANQIPSQIVGDNGTYNIYFNHSNKGVCSFDAFTHKTRFISQASADSALTISELMELCNLCETIIKILGL